MRAMANISAVLRGEWSGAPIPVDHVELVMEKRYPFKALNGATFGKKKEEPRGDGRVVNKWYSFKLHSQIVIVEEKDGKRWHVVIPIRTSQRSELIFDTLGVAAHEVWTVDAELQAVEKLKELVTPQAYKCYMLNGCFLETSQRSKVAYLFRKLRPTIAMRPTKDGDSMTILTAMCLHPLGYYSRTFAGVMTPTDDVIAHLLMMRGCEHKFWAKANHHSPWMPSSGI